MKAILAATLCAVLALACAPAAASRPAPAEPEPVAVRDVGSEREVSLKIQELM